MKPQAASSPEQAIRPDTTTRIRTPHRGTLIDRRRAADSLYATGHMLLLRRQANQASGVFRAMAHLLPTDERAWLGLGACHEALAQPEVALEIYGAGRTISPVPVRLEIARARVLRGLGRGEEAERAMVHASDHAERLNDDELRRLVAHERSRT